ncbi:tetratricopeptide repeat protein [candidate division CSSED10-310 bacterium]|uniref:Tetratricopeptide repeat protein n=1 Tax=candidate division CSSED10-310 bacterium TaxID=2855610 RepID=A0ABV6YTI6_UNCC1
MKNSASASTHIGPYLLQGELGRGGMGVVYRAQHRQTKQSVALKTVSIPQESQLQSFRREIHALSRVHHPGIIPIIDEGVEAGLPWYAMELLQGHTLRAWIRKEWTVFFPERNQEKDVPWVYPSESGYAPSGDKTAQLDLHQNSARTDEAPLLTDPAASESRSQRLSDQLDPTANNLVIDGTHEVASDLLTAQEGMKPDRAVKEQFREHVRSPFRSERFDLTSRNFKAYLSSMLSLIRSLCEPLAFLHGEGIIHRDLKPGNIFVRQNGKPVLLDFGLVMITGGEVYREAAEIGIIAAGTAAYMTPEQIRGEFVDARADLYSLGCILYEFITGRSPFWDDTISQILRGHLHLHPVTPSHINPLIPAELDALILQLLEKDPRHRPGYVDDLAKELEKFGAVNCFGARVCKPRSYLYRPGLAGRNTQMLELNRQFQAMLRGQGNVILIGGESGIGKTRLIKEFARLALEAKAYVLVGECQDSETAPLVAFRKPLQALADRCQDRGQAETDRLFGQKAKILSLYETALGTLPGQENYAEFPPLPPESARHRVFSSLAQVFESLSKQENIILILDDLQWADELSLAFLNFITKRAYFQSLPVLLIGLYRSEEMPDDLKKLLDSSHTSSLKLARLNEEAVEYIIQDMLALPTTPPLFSRFLYRQSEGNPLFVAEYLRTAIDTGLLWRDQRSIWQIMEPSLQMNTEDDYDKLPLPKSLRELVNRRMINLTASAKTILKSAAVLGKEISRILLQEMTACDSTAFWEATTELLNRNILEEIPGDRLIFVHDKIREIAYENVEPDERKTLHKTAAQGLENDESPESVLHFAALGMHWEKAGEPKRARTYYLEGARKASNSFANKEAEKLYKAFLSLVVEKTPLTTQGRIEFANFLHLTGRFEEALTQISEAFTAAQSFQDQALMGGSLYSMANILCRLGKFEKALGYCEQALTIFRETNNLPRVGETFNLIGTIYWYQSRLDEARSFFEKALNNHQRADNRMAQGVTLGNLAEVNREQGYTGVARELLKQALKIHRSIKNTRFEGLTLGNLGNISEDLGQNERAIEFYKRALKILCEVGDRLFEGVTHGNLAGIFAATAVFTEADHHYEKALNIAREIGDRDSEGAFLSSRAQLKRRQGHNPHNLKQDLERAESLLRAVDDLLCLTTCLCEQGHLALAQGVNAQDFLEQSLSMAAVSGVTPATESEVGRALLRLQNAQKTFERNQQNLLFRGELLADIPEKVRQWLIETGQLAKSKQ